MATTSRDGRELRSEATKATLVATARDLFAERGYSAISAGDIARSAGVTRNAFYYHFATKEAVFRAVYEDVEATLAARVIPAAVSRDGIGGQLTRAVDAFLDGCLDPTVARISVIEAPAALGFSQMREIDNRNYLGALSDALAEAVSTGELPDLPAGTLASMLIGALDEAALLIASAADPTRARREAGVVAHALVSGIITR